MPAGDNSRIQTMFHQQTDRVKFIRNLIKTSQMCKIKTRNTKSVQAPLHQIKKKKKKRTTSISYYFLFKNSMGYFLQLENSKCS